MSTNCRYIAAALIALSLAAPVAAAPAARPSPRPFKVKPLPTMRPSPSPAGPAESNPEVLRRQQALAQAARGNPWADAYYQAALDLIGAYRAAGRPQDALRVGEELLARTDAVIDTKKALSELLEKKEKELAAREFATAAKYAFRRDELLFLLGELHRDTGNREQAALRFASIMLSQPDSELAKKALEQLRNLGWFAADEEVK